MVPRLHKRGKSFKGACSYILHDPGASTTERVLCAETLNLSGAPDNAWREMHATWKDRVRLKRAAGVDLRGRDNKSPVLHMTLSWHAEDNPSLTHMRDTARDALKAIGLDHHQALLAVHCDKQHMHAHLVINTVDPENGRTAPMKFTKERLSKWAEGYERDHGIRCEQRIENNKKREEAKTDRKLEAISILLAGDQAAAIVKAPFVPVKDQSVNRKTWFEKQEIVARMKEMRARYEQPHKLERGILAAKHREQRQALWQNTKAASDNAREHIKARYKSVWRDLYREQRREARQLDMRRNHPLERAVYVFLNRQRLSGGKPLDMKQMAGLILKPNKLLSHVDKMHERERRKLARIQSADTHQHTAVIMAQHRIKADRLSAEQSNEREAQWAAQREIKEISISFTLAKQELIAEHQIRPPPAPSRPLRRARAAEPQKPNVSVTFAQEAVRPPAGARQPFNDVADRHSRSRSEELRREMEAWRKRNGGRDFGREL